MGVGATLPTTVFYKVYTRTVCAVELENDQGAHKDKKTSPKPPN